ncbi:MAG: hypothetical protein EXX96DRAFT_550855 [Benjaminiella poitrasii]|nr:MAG: hypothetical protein EXX96DRAFT_550855 [Benjaminiella poitrasii]
MNSSSNNDNSNTTDHIKWLIPMPSGISTTTHDSFTQDLLQQFDKKTYQILYDNNISNSAITSVIDQQNRSSIHSCTLSTATTNSSNHYDSASNSRQTRSDLSHTIQHQLKDDSSLDEVRSKRRSAGGLLRKSSAFLRGKFQRHSRQQTLLTAAEANNKSSNTASFLNHFYTSLSLKSNKKKKREETQFMISKDIDVVDDINILYLQQQRQQFTPNNIVIPSQSRSEQKLREKSMLIPQQQEITGHNFIVQPPIITQYPPKPLKYSPIEPLLTENADYYRFHYDHAGTENKKRRSLPLLHLTLHSRTLEKRRSDSIVLNEQEPILLIPPEETSMNTLISHVQHSLNKQWNKFLSTCQLNNTTPSKRKQEKSPLITL